MKTVYILAVLAVLVRKAWFAWLRGWTTYCSDRTEHDSLREYLLANGATDRQALRPFVRHAIERSFRPLTGQWRLLLILLVAALLAGLLADDMSVLQALLLLPAMLAGVLCATFAAVCVCIRIKK